MPGTDLGTRDASASETAAPPLWEPDFQQRRTVTDTRDEEGRSEGGRTGRLAPKPGTKEGRSVGVRLQS